MAKSSTKVTEGKVSDLVFDDKNFNKGTEYGKALIDKSVERFGAGRSVVVDKNMRLMAGNKFTEAFGEHGGEDIVIVETTGDKLVVVKRTDMDLDTKEGRDYALADNATAKADLAWDNDVIGEVQQELGIEPGDWGVRMEGYIEGPENGEESEEEEFKRKEKEFRERMESGELSEDDPEYQAFLKKFQAKKTTDDCYTPAIVYDAVADWVAKEYGLSRAKFVRPFYPGGDYQNEKYKPGDIVVDNPPFSILAEILRFYDERGIKFFLFAPTVTLFSSSSSSTATALPCAGNIIYENGANVPTSFLTNLEDRKIRARSCPTLYKAIKEANEENLGSTRKELPKYNYDHHVVTSTFMGQLSRLGIEFVVTVDESVPISQLDSQKESGKTIFGKGYLIGERLFAEREKAEREKAEREKAERWELSPRELEIVAQLSKQDNAEDK